MPSLSAPVCTRLNSCEGWPFFFFLIAPVLFHAEWDEFKTLDWETIYTSMNKPAFVFDGRLWVAFLLTFMCCYRSTDDAPFICETVSSTALPLPRSASR
jgi:hypothetical protein